MRYFHDELKHEIVPILLDSKHPFPKLRDKNIYLAVLLRKHGIKKNYFALIQIPSNYPRFYKMEEDNKSYFILTDDIIRLNLDSIFFGSIVVPFFTLEKY